MGHGHIGRFGPEIPIVIYGWGLPGLSSLSALPPAPKLGMTANALDLDSKSYWHGSHTSPFSLRPVGDLGSSALASLPHCNMNNNGAWTHWKVGPEIPLVI